MDAILEDISVSETIVKCYITNLKAIIFQYSKNYQNLTRITRLQVAANMADPILLALIKGIQTVA